MLQPMPAPQDFSFASRPNSAADVAMALAEAEGAKLGLSVSALVLEGFRRVDEWRLMESTIHFDQVIVVDQVAMDALGESKLTRPEKLVLDAVNGTRTVSQVIKESSVGSFDAIKIVYQFLQSRVLRSRPNNPPAG